MSSNSRNSSTTRNSTTDNDDRLPPHVKDLHNYQYVGPYRLEKTLGKGQTGKVTVDLVTSLGSFSLFPFCLLPHHDTYTLCIIIFTFFNFFYSFFLLRSFFSTVHAIRSG